MTLFAQKVHAAGQPRLDSVPAGGIGVLDFGLLGVLSRSGVDRATAVAALGRPAGDG